MGRRFQESKQYHRACARTNVARECSTNLIVGECEASSVALVRNAVSLLFILGLGACQAGAQSVPVGVVGYNHTDTRVAEFSVDIGGGGSFVRAHDGGSSTVCCARVPAKWHQGLQIQVKWTDDLKTYHRRAVPIPDYGVEVGHLAVHFLRSGEVRSFVTPFYLGHPRYPLTGEEAGLSAGEDTVREEWR